MPLELMPYAMACTYSNPNTVLILAGAWIAAASFVLVLSMFWHITPPAFACCRSSKRDDGEGGNQHII